MTMAKATGSAAPATEGTSSHPPVARMVVDAIKSLNERHGSSLQAIKKHMTTTFMVNVDKLAVYIKRFLKKAVADGVLIQTKGTGANGSFKLGSNAKVGTNTGKKTTTTTARKTKKPAPRKSAAKPKTRAPAKKIKKPAAKKVKPAPTASAKPAVAPKRPPPKERDPNVKPASKKPKKAAAPPPKEKITAVRMKTSAATKA